MIYGVIATLVVLFFASVLRLFFTRFSNRSFANVVPYLRPDGEDVLQELMDPSLERFLAQNLGHRQFREKQLDRMRLADEYFDHRKHNAIVCQGWGDTEVRNAREIGDEDLRTAADALVVACAEFRIGASAAQFQLHMWQFKLILLPFARLPRISRLRKLDYFDVFESYDKIRESALALAQLCGTDCHNQLLDVI
jgi:hypothetical protein